MQVAGAILGDFFVQRGAPRTPNSVQVPQKQNLTLPVTTAIRETASNDRRGEENIRTNGLDSDKGRALSLFQANGETFELNDNRIKAKNGSDFVRRATYLFLYTSELHGKNSASYEEIKIMLQKAKCWDANTRTWLAKGIGLAKEGEDGYKLTATGREDATKALADALDPSLPDNWNPDKKPVRKVGPKKKA